MKTIQVQDKTYEVEITDKSVVELRVMTPGSINSETYYYDTINQILFPVPDGIICDEERYNKILAAVQEMCSAKQIKTATQTQ
jgi:type IV secretory pathway ATPase VirB11/archaellum biosynthesis ATPase